MNLSAAFILTPLFSYVKFSFFMLNFFYKIIFKTNIYTLFIYLFIILITTSSKSYSKVYKIENVEIKQPYNVYFKKEIVIEKAIIESFNLLVKSIIKSEDLNKVNFQDINKIKPMLDSFSITDEQFVNNNYSAKFNVLFQKKDVLNYLNKRNIISSSPIKKQLFFLPVLINLKNNELVIYNENQIYLNWNTKEDESNLLSYFVPDEDLEDYNLIKKNINNIENYNFTKILSKYNAKDYIVSIIFKDEKSIKILSRISLNDNLNISNLKFDGIKKLNNKNSNIIVQNLKIYFENEWKKVNEINTSIKLPLTVSLDSKKIKLINRFEQELNLSDLVYDYNIESINSYNTIYKIIYNGSPDKFLSKFKNKKFNVDISNKVWIIND
tara:strand:- start:866 stop:2011 length:1146 start_codon:yes stop_codon:yes gene_type:complete